LRLKDSGDFFKCFFRLFHVLKYMLTDNATKGSILEWKGRNAENMINNILGIDVAGYHLVLFGEKFSRETILACAYLKNRTMDAFV
jgi:hypothetical protein